MEQITVDKNVAGIEGLCVITPVVHGDSVGASWKPISELCKQVTLNPFAS